MPTPLLEPLPAEARHGTSLLDAALAWAGRLSRIAVWAAGALTLASVLLITVDVLLRKIAGRGIGGSDELAGYVFAISTSWAFAFATLQRAHVRVDVLYHRLPTRVAAAVDWLCLVAFAIFFAYLARFGFDVVRQSFAQDSRSNSALGMHLWIPQLLWFLGIAWMCIVTGLLLLRAGSALVHGDVASVQRWAGVRSAKEEAVEEASAGERIVQGERK
ncbi:TRAP transporter small permease subunit [Variovorax defluvii]|uniref:TRAP transporter small permease subunit n=1 Tax=Variovorax defluvii TaxID=913761 RepID=UPI003CD0AB4D